MAGAGDLTIEGINYAKMQMLNVQEILDGKRFHTPGAGGRGLPQPTLRYGQEAESIK